MRWLIGKCAGCGRDIVRRYRDKPETCGNTLTFVCRCSPGLEAMRKYIIDGSVLVIWDEVLA